MRGIISGEGIESSRVRRKCLGDRGRGTEEKICRLQRWGRVLPEEDAAERGSKVHTQTTTASFSGHMVDLLTSDGQHQGALGRDASAYAHQATFTSSAVYRM